MKKKHSALIVLAAILGWVAVTAILFNLVLVPPELEPGAGLNLTGLVFLLIKIVWVIVSIVVMILMVTSAKSRKLYGEGYVSRALRGATHGNPVADVAAGKNLKAQEEAEKKYRWQAPRAVDNKAQGLILGRVRPEKAAQVAYSPYNSDKHALCIATSGQGKTSGFLRPTINHWPADPANAAPGEPTGTVFALDISGDISSRVHRPGAIIFDMKHSAQSNIRYDLLAPVLAAPDFAHQMEEIWRIVEILLPKKPNLNSGAKYFVEGGQDFLAACLLDCVNDRCGFPAALKRMNDQSVKNWISEAAKRDRSPNGIISVVGKYADELPTNASGCKNEATRTLRPFFTDADVARAFTPTAGTENFNYQTIEKQSVFVIIPQADLAVLSPVMALLAAQLCKSFIPQRQIYGDNITEVLVCLDELPAYYIDGLQTTLATARKYHCTIAACCQSFSQLDETYGKNNRISLVNNFAYTIALGTREYETAKAISDMVGQEKHLQNSTHYGSHGENHYNDSWQREAIVDPGDIMHPDGEKALIISLGGYEWLYTNFDFKYGAQTTSTDARRSQALPPHSDYHKQSLSDLRAWVDELKQ